MTVGSDVEESLQGLVRFHLDAEDRESAHARTEEDPRVEVGKTA